ncbi:MAG: hypothetical protein HQK91_06530 [Nitrospirae bacterium]|nr:hypothetical protein [Nitrospirota bacterium]MBF0541089.1 hypothetical protein [Nitrospirota bacterium]
MEFEGMERISSIFGILAATLFIIANAYYPARAITRRLGIHSKEMNLFFKNYLKLHIFANVTAVLLVAFHGHYADERNILLKLCMAVTIWLTIAGAMMHYKYPKGMKKHLRLLHTQRIMIFVWLWLIILGHMA